MGTRLALDIANTIHRETVQAAGAAVLDRRAARTTKERLADYDIPDQAGLCERLLPYCPWAKRYVTVAAQLGSMCTWRPYYRGQLVDSALIDGAVKSIQPSGSKTQKQMREQSIRLQQSPGVHGIVITGHGPGGGGFSVAHPETLIKPKSGSTSTFVFKTRENAKPDQPGWNEYPLNRLTRHYIPSDMYDEEPASSLEPALEFMKMYCSMLEAAMATVDQRKVASSLIHLKLDEPETSEWGEHDPKAAPGENQPSAEKQVVMDMMSTWRKGYEEGGLARILPHLLLWQGDVNLIELGAILPPETMQSLQDVARRGVEGLPIPNIWLLDGTGTSNHWGDAELRRELHNQTIYPALEIHDHAWTIHAFQPLIHSLLGDDPSATALDGANDPNLWELRSDRNCIDVKSDNTAMWIDLAKCGLLSLQGLVDKVPDLEMEDLVEIPEGISESEHLATLLGGRNNNDRQGFTQPPAIEPPQAPDPDTRPVAASAQLRSYLV